MTYTDADSTPAKQNRRTWRKKAAQYIKMARETRGLRAEALNQRFVLARAARFCRRMAWRIPE